MNPPSQDPTYTAIDSRTFYLSTTTSTQYSIDDIQAEIADLQSQIDDKNALIANAQSAIPSLNTALIATPPQQVQL